MADTFTEFLTLTKPEIGASRDSWGTKWNDNAGTIDSWAKSINTLVRGADNAGGIAANFFNKNETTTKQSVQGNPEFLKGLDITKSGLAKPFHIEVGTAGKLNIQGSAATADFYFSLDTSGAVVTKQMGDVRDFIRNSVAAKAARWVFIIDRDTAEQSLVEPHPGCAITGYRGSSSGEINRVRYRQLQVSDAIGTTWYASTYS